jgi:hypothetical protein
MPGDDLILVVDDREAGGSTTVGGRDEAGWEANCDWVGRWDCVLLLESSGSIFGTIP